ncbi:unnamed protein product, partial [marine sediment metagenome]
MRGIFLRIKFLIISKIKQKRIALHLQELYLLILKFLRAINLNTTLSYIFFRYFWYHNKLKGLRYQNLIRTIYKEKSCNLIEVGTFDGEHGYLMIKTAQICHPVKKVNYYGFDLFE